MAFFETLYKLEINHDYYSDERSIDFEVVPSTKTKNKLRDLRFLFRGGPSGCSVLSQVEKSSMGLSAYRVPEQPVRFQFFLKQKRPHFLNYTDLPFHQLGQTIYYFNNLQANVVGGSKYLHPSSSQVTSADQLPLKKGNYLYKTTGTDQHKTARLLYSDLDIEIEQQAENNEGEFQFQFDLSGNPSGRAELWIDGSLQEHFYAVNQLDMAGVFGIVDIFHSQDVPGAYQFLDSNGIVDTQVYKLYFNNRSTYWKYIIINRTGTDLDDPGISDSDNNYTFTQDTTSSHPGNHTIFISDQEIPLLQESIGSLSLRKRFSTDNLLVLDSLPNPASEMLMQDQNVNTKYYSEVFLYL
ncbi:MAG: hypothetical protein U5K69_28755 [Balneolaceae bacterium]|nr:hypothetical protein [Balneolaceae bacterium]